MELNEKIRIEINSTLTNVDNKVLSLLYLPLIKKNAYTLYNVLSSLHGMEVHLEQLLQITMLNEGMFEKNRKVLEQFQLMKTLYEPVKKEWQFYICSPLAPVDFLRHESFARLFLKEKGQTYFAYMKRIFVPEKEERWVDISEAFDISLLSDWNQVQESQYKDTRIVENWKEEYPFDFNKFLQNMDYVFPAVLRSKENLSRIARLASIYGVDEIDMKKLVQKNTNPSSHEINFENLQNDLVKKKVPQVKEYANPYAMPPIQFLASKQTGPLSAIEKQVVTNLCTNYGFINEVVNVLIEYVLKTSNNGFNKNYVETIASSWSRNKVDTYEKAIEQTNWKNKETKSTLPEWYGEVPQEKADDAYLEQLLSRQKQMKGEN